MVPTVGDAINAVGNVGDAVTSTGNVGWAVTGCIVGKTGMVGSAGTVG